MEKKNATTSEDDTSRRAATATTNEVAAALLEILRSVDRQAARPAPELSREALAAVERFRAISAALDVVPFSASKGKASGGSAAPA